MRLHIAILSMLLASAAPGEENVIRNGSFEGSLGYWITEGKGDARPDGEKAAFGSFAVRLEGASLRSASFPLARGRPVRISFSARSAEPAEVAVSVCPSQREIAQAAKLAWNPRYRGKTGPEWKRFSFTFTPDVAPNKAWWPESVWILTIGGPKCAYWIDGITVAPEGGEQDFLARRPVEVTADAPDLAPYTEGGRLLDRGAKVNVRATAYNATAAERPVTLRWQLMDYTGSAAVSAPIERKVTIPAGKTAVESVEMTLDSPGLVLARASALDDAGKPIDSSDMPLTTLPFPKAATEPDVRERFGASFRGPLTVSMGRRIGFRWSRWYPHFGWDRVQPDGPDAYTWPDATVEELQKQGIAMVAVVYRLPKWAKGEKNLPKDMQWPSDDAKWNDLAIETSWDRFIAAEVRRYAGRPIVWEFENEPDLAKWDHALYAALARRTERIVRKADPKAVFGVNCTWPGPTPIQMDFFKAGGAKFIDFYSWHNYAPGPAADGDAIRRMRAIFASFGKPAVRIWFDEGWTYFNTSHDYPALPLTRLTGAEAAHAMVRSVADMQAAGQEKFIMFHIGYAGHGRSWWDWVGSGTELWDDHGDPTAAVAAWNVLIDQLGLSEFVATVRPKGAAIHVFDDLRNRRGVAVAYAVKGAVSLELPIAGAVVRTVMGADTPAKDAGGKSVIELPADRRPFYIYTKSGMSGKDLAAALAPLDEIAAERASGKIVYRLPAEWAGTEIGSAAGNPAQVGGRPVWRLDRLWPEDPMKAENYRTLTWSGSNWNAKENSHGGQPCATAFGGKVELGCRTAWPGQPGRKIAVLIFIAPAAGRYAVWGEAAANVWEGKGPVDLDILRINRQTREVMKVASIQLQSQAPAAIEGIEADLADGDELIFAPRLPGGLVAANFTLRDLRISVAAPAK